MINVIAWLKSIEFLAYNIYEQSASYFKDDQELSNFLIQLAKDESWHYHLMGSAANYIKTEDKLVSSAIVIDDTTKTNIEMPIKRISDQLSKGTITKQGIIDSIVEAEFSEWNDIFLYTLKTMMEHNKIFQYVAASVQSHIAEVENYIGSLPDNLKPRKNIRELSPIWETRILIVDDDELLLELLRDLLKSRGIIDIAPDGKQGLELTRRNFYDVIISDIDMPVMDGIDFYINTVRDNPGIKSKFLFCSGDMNAEKRRLLKENDLDYLEKPFSLDIFFEKLDSLLKIGI